MHNARSSVVTTFRELLALWPENALAADLGVTFPTVNTWTRTGRIPEPNWKGLVASARRRRIPGVTLALLGRLPSARGATSFREVLSLWPSTGLCAADLGLPTTTVRSWQARSRVPLEYWGDLIASAPSHGIRHLTHSQLQNIALAGPPTRRRTLRPHQCVTDAPRIAQGQAPRPKRAASGQKPVLTGE